MYDKTLSVLVWLLIGTFVGLAIDTYILGYTKPATLVVMLKKQCDGGKIANERQYDCHASINAVLRYKDGSYTLEWLEDGGVQKKE